MSLIISTKKHIFLEGKSYHRGLMRHIYSLFLDQIPHERNCQEATSIVYVSLGLSPLLSQLLLHFSPPPHGLGGVAISFCTTTGLIQIIVLSCSLPSSICVIQALDYLVPP